MPSSCSNRWCFWCGAQHQIVNTDTCTGLLNFKVMCWQKPEDCLGCDTRTGMENNSLLVTLLLEIWESLTETPRVSYSTLTWGSKYDQKPLLAALTGDCKKHRKSWPKPSRAKKETPLHVSLPMEILWSGGKYKRNTWELSKSGLSNFPN